MWTNKKKHGNRKYKGKYDRLNGERVFVLVGYIKNQRLHTVTFESHQMAKSMGWKKCKKK